MPVPLQFFVPLLIGLAALLIGVVIWPPIGFFFFLSIDIVKGHLRSYAPFLSGYTYDMTVLVAAFVGTLWHSLRSQYRVSGLIPRRFVVAWVILIFLVWVGLPFSRSIDYGWKKALIFSVFDTMTCLLPFMYFKHIRDAGSVLLICIILGIATLSGLVFLGTLWQGISRTTVMYANPLAPADFCAYLIIILLSLWIAERKLWQFVLAAVFVPLALYGVFLTGTRGPIVSLPFVVLAVLYLHRRSFDFRFPLAAAVLVAVLVFGTMATITPELMVRFQSKYVEKGVAERGQLLRITLEGWASSPIYGNGTGDTAYQIGGANFEGYPHNAILEVANEFGVIGLVPFLIVVGYGFAGGVWIDRHMPEGRDKTIIIPFFGCFLHHFFMAMKGGGYAGSFTFYFFLACTVALYRLARIQSEQGMTWAGGEQPLLLPDSTVTSWAFPHVDSYGPGTESLRGEPHDNQ